MEYQIKAITKVKIRTFGKHLIALILLVVFYWASMSIHTMFILIAVGIFVFETWYFWFRKSLDSIYFNTKEEIIIFEFRNLFNKHRQEKYDFKDIQFSYRYEFFSKGVFGGDTLTFYINDKRKIKIHNEYEGFPVSLLDKFVSVLQEHGVKAKDVIRLFP
jgi:hypothetical protein